jgi:capsular exopolysaccharide synthesis family protein
MTKIYSASATLLIEDQEVNIVSIEELYGIDPSQKAFFTTQIQILNSRELAERVVKKLQLSGHPEFDPSKNAGVFAPYKWLPFLSQPLPLSEEAQFRYTVGLFQSMLAVSAVNTTQIVKISYEASDPELSYQVANTVGSEYINGDLEARLALTQTAAQWLTTRLDGMRTDLERSETDLQAYRERENLIDVGGVQTLTASDVGKLTGSLLEARSVVAGLSNQIETLGDLSQYDEDWESYPGVLSDSLARQLKAKEADSARAVSELSRRFGPKHPKLMAAISNEEEAKAAYHRQVVKVVSGFDVAYRKALADERILQVQLDRSKNEIQSINRKNYQLSQLERDVEANQQLYDLFFTRFKETNGSQFGSSVARFIDRALQPEGPVRPNVRNMILIATFLSFAIGFALALLRDYLDNTIRTPGAVEGKLNQVVIGVLPRVDISENPNLIISEAVLDDTQRIFAEAIRTARTGVALSGIDTPLKRLVVTSSVPGEGKTTMAMNLAFAFGQMGKVILLDADMRRPSVAGNCQLGNKSPGLSNIIAGTEDLGKCIYKYKGIDIIPAGIIPPNPLELLSSKRFEELLETLADKYDRVVIDSAPTQAVSDSLVLSGYVDGVLYVVKSDATSASIAQDGLQRLLRVNANILGIVLNQFDAAHAAKYGGYGYSKGHYDYYGYGSNKAY